VVKTLVAFKDINYEANCKISKKAREDEEKLDDILTELDVATVPAVPKVVDGEVERSIIGVDSENKIVKEVSYFVKRDE